jgi:hypothetical protein
MRCTDAGMAGTRAWHNWHMYRRVRILIVVVLLAAAHVSSLALAQAAAPVARAEVQIGVCTPLPDVVAALQLRAPGPVTTTWLFDDAQLNLLRRGLRLRLRIDSRSADLTLKVADQDCARLPATAIPAGQGKCEMDLHGATMTGAMSLSQPLSRAHADALVAGATRVQDALSPAQVNFLRDVEGGGPLPTTLLPLGPLSVISRQAADRSYAVDVTTLPGGEQYLEVTRKVRVDRAERTRHSLEQSLTRAGVTLCADQSGQAAIKMRKLLPAGAR